MPAFQRANHPPGGFAERRRWMTGWRTYEWLSRLLHSRLTLPTVNPAHICKFPLGRCRTHGIVDIAAADPTIAALTTEYTDSYLEWLRVGPYDATATAD